MHTDFIELSAILRNEYLLKTEALYVTQQQRWFAAFVEHFQTICAEIGRLQSELFLSPISRIEYTMLYTNFINRRYVSEVWVCGDKSYLDKNQCIIGEFDISQLFVFFNELWDKLLSLRKRYVGKVTAKDVTSIIIQALPEFYSYLANIVRGAIPDLLDKQPFANIIKNETFKIYVGDYMANTIPVYIERKEKDIKALHKHINKRLNKEYTFQDYGGLDFSGRSYTYTEFSYTQFRHCNMTNASLEGSVMIGTSFRRANMENCCLNNCAIFEADFSHAILKNARLINVQGQAGLPNEKEWLHAGVLPVSFRHADLTNADFSCADLTGADFTDAILNGVNFTSTKLDGAIFGDSFDMQRILFQ